MQHSRLFFFYHAENYRPSALKIHILFFLQIQNRQDITKIEPSNSCRVQSEPRSTARHRERGYRNRQGIEGRRRRRRPAQGRCLGKAVIDCKTERSKRYIDACSQHQEVLISEANRNSRNFNFLCIAVSQDPAKRAQFRVAVLGGGARPRERTHGDRPGGGRETRPATKARKKQRSRARDRRRTEPGLRPRR